MKHLLRVSLLAAVLSASVLAFSQSAAGTWNGRIDASGMKPQDAQQEMMVAQLKTMLPLVKMKLTMMPNRTYRLNVTRGPGRKGDTESGKWTQAGRTVTIRPHKGAARKMTISANGRTMVMMTSAGGVKGMRVVFTKS